MGDSLKKLQSLYGWYVHVAALSFKIEIQVCPLIWSNDIKNHSCFDAYMSRKLNSTLVQGMAWRQVSANPFSEPMVTVWTFLVHYTTISIQAIPIRYSYKQDQNKTA